MAALETTDRRVINIDGNLISVKIKGVTPRLKHINDRRL